MRFYLGVHMVNWLERAGVPLFVSHTRLRRRRSYPRAIAPWALDSGGFSELTAHGRWTIGPVEYFHAVKRYADEIGLMDWAAIQDWMCEPHLLARTGLTIAEHQERTCDSYDNLLALSQDLPWRPVLQGWTLPDYLRHAEMYQRRGLPMTSFGVGSVCRRQGTDEITAIFRGLQSAGLRLHGFGVKTRGLVQCAPFMESADSMAWSLRARWAGNGMANSLPFALDWRVKLLRRITGQRALAFAP